MATYQKGILGPFSGTVGTVVGANWRGKSIMRSRPKKTTHTPSETQLRQRLLFAFVMQFITPIKPILSQYFGHKMGVRSRLNLATSYTMKEATLWTGTDYQIIYNKFMISKGELQGIQNPTASALAGRKVKLEWEDNSGQGMALPEDQLLVVFYAPLLGVFEVVEQAAQRQDTEVEITLPLYLSGAEVELWGTFVNDDYNRAATSSYLGQLTIT